MRVLGFLKKMSVKEIICLVNVVVYWSFTFDAWYLIQNRKRKLRFRPSKLQKYFVESQDGDLFHRNVTGMSGPLERP